MPPRSVEVQGTVNAVWLRLRWKDRNRSENALTSALSVSLRSAARSAGRQRLSRRVRINFGLR